MYYAEYFTAIQDYCENSEVSFLLQINNFIRFTEDKIFSSMTSPIYWKSSTSVAFTSASNTYETAPGVLDILSVRLVETPSGTVGPVRNLLRKDLAFLYESYPVDSSGNANTGIPKYYAVTSAQKSTSTPTDPSMNIVIAPIPSVSGGNTYNATIDYYGKSTSDSITYGVVQDSQGVVSGNLTNTTWLSIAFPEVLLYGSLVHAYTYMKGEAAILEDYKDKFNQGLMLIKNLSESRQDTDEYSDLGKPSSGL